MAKGRFRMLTGLTGLLVATGVHGLLDHRGDGWVGSAYAQEAEDEDTAAADESNAEESGATGESESEGEWALAQEDSGTDEEAATVDEEEAADSEAATSADEASAEPAEEPAEPEQAPDAATEAPAAPNSPETPRPQIASKMYDKADRVREALHQRIREVLPALTDHEFTGSDSLKALGANSVDRAEIIMLTLETLGVNVPLIELAKAENLGALTELITSKMP